MTTHGPFSFATQGGADADRFIYDGPVQSGATLPAAAGTTRNICHDTNGGNSTNVGPDFGQGGDPEGYLYTEMSSPGASGDIFTIEFDTVLDCALEQFQFNFYTCQRGPAIGNNQSTCQVQINENDTGWVDVGAQIGGSGDDTTTTVWVSRSIDLSNGGLNTDANTRVRIEITSQAATAWHGDYGIDTIEIVGTLLSTPHEQEGYRWREDDGSESAASARQNQDTVDTVAQEERVRLRVLMDQDGDPPSTQATLQYKRDDEAAAEWRDV